MSVLFASGYEIDLNIPEKSYCPYCHKDNIYILSTLPTNKNYYLKKIKESVIYRKYCRNIFIFKLRDYFRWVYYYLLCKDCNGGFAKYFLVARDYYERTNTILKRIILKTNPPENISLFLKE
jgi:hypothetical protein